MSPAEISVMMNSVSGNVPLGTDLYAQATFEAAHGNLADIPATARAWYENMLNPIPDDLLKVAIGLLENTTHEGCVPLAILKERLGLGKAIVGKLGFKHRGAVTDWEFGGAGITWY